MFADFTNHNLTDIVTPVDADKLEELLIYHGYDVEKRNYLVNGFRFGFDLGYRGPKIVKRTAPNLKLRVGSKQEHGGGESQVLCRAF